MIHLHIVGWKWPNCWKFPDFSLHKIELFQPTSTWKRPMPKSTLVQIVLKNCSPLLRTVESKLEISCFVIMYRQKIGIFKNLNISGILAYELPNKKNFEKHLMTFFFLLFSYFWKSFGWFPMTSTPEKALD